MLSLSGTGEVLGFDLPARELHQMKKGSTFGDGAFVFPAIYLGYVDAANLGDVGFLKVGPLEELLDGHGEHVRIRATLDARKKFSYKLSSRFYYPYRQLLAYVQYCSVA
jgi:hypothetical protein